MEATMTIQEFNAAMQEQETNGLMAVFSKIIEAASPANVREARREIGPAPQQDWVGWK